MPDLTYTKQAFEVDPHLRMQNTSKPGGITPITLPVGVCAADIACEQAPQWRKSTKINERAKRAERRLGKRTGRRSL